MASSLEEKILNVQDVTDSEAFDEVLIYLDQIQMQDEEFMEKLLARRDDMVISWELPWYQKSNCLTKKVFDNELLEEADQKEAFRTDAVSSDESNKIDNNWQKLRKLFNLPDTPICLARWKNISKSRNPRTAEECARRFVISFLAQGLERNLHQNL
ncbi:uncharacterized protein LOC121735885 isoform X2 [Aricia agestis]|uniref:uncharacterized protein LOC121735885 isoform X2 n=1 Tax=Aricia agestis TaxID=91739 RepID=UPI001C205081|nr:uncharacterized protein LOC121735885 isoform X2 [Aricia agestis]